MSSRRRLLQIIASSFKWIAHSFTNLYYSLIPTIINGKKVQDKAKVVKVYGNSEVKNQLARTLFDTTQNGITFTASNSGRKVVLSGTSSGYFIYTLSFGTTLPTNSVVLVSIKVKNPNNVFFGYRLRQNNITPMDYSGSAYIQVRTITSAIDCIQFYGNPNIDYTGVEIEDVQLVCLTQRFPFNTPTTLTDPRVQKILNGGYEEYNLGEIVDVDMSEIDSEPYNLFDGELEMGTLDGANGIEISATTRCRTKYIPLVPNKNYRLEMYNSGGDKTLWVVDEYDTNKNFIRGNILVSQGFTASPNSGYLRFAVKKVDNSDCQPSDFDNAQLCLFLQGTRTGYAPHTQLYTLPFKYQGAGVGTAHDTMEQTGTEYVFTKAMNEVDLSTYTFTHDTTNDIWYSVINTMVNGVWNTKPNILCDKYATYESRYSDELSNVNKICTIWSTTNRFLIKDTSITQASDIVGNLKFELATPQIIRIPRKHLGVVRIKDLSWSYNSSEANHERFYTTSLSSVIKNIDAQTLGNLYSTHLMTKTDGEVYSHVSNQIIGTHNGTIQVYDKNCSTTQQLLDKYGNDLIFYETENEVADIDLTILVEAGGTLTSNWFSWVRNQLCSDNFGNTVVYWTKNRLTQTNNNNVGTFVTNSNAYNYVGFYRQSSSDFKKNHKYLFSIKARKTSGNATTISLGWQNNTEVVITNNAQTNVWYECSAIFTQTRDDGTNTNAMGTTFYYGSTSDIVVGTDSYEAKEPMLFDLTLGFGAGKEPTDINDPIIREILRLGYIPTDVSGTTKSIASEVLPNIDFKIKCK